MSIKFYIPDYNNNNPKRASFRFRATIPLKGMRPEDGIISHIEEAKENDLVVLAKKSKPKDVHYLKERNINISQSNINLLINKCNGDRGLLKKELEKIRNFNVSEFQTVSNGIHNR